MLNWLLRRSSDGATHTPHPADVQRYVDSVARLPRPTDQQIAEFVEYVSTAHSWYKHLPLLPPGRPFMFYLDPNAGREWIENGSRSGFRDRLADAPLRERFHYTWQPTSDYVARFGYLTYFAAVGTSFRVPMKNGVLSTALTSRIQVKDRRAMGVNACWISVPEDVAKDGTVYLTGVIHPIAQEVMLWFLGQHRIGPYAALHLDLDGYDESTADDIVRTAIGLLRRVMLSEHWKPLPESEELETRVLPEWAEIQKRQMSQAIHCMLDRIYAGRMSEPAV